jgi:hypothetical protein
MTYLTYLVAAVVVALGAAAVVFGEADDSPGLQVIGVVVALAAVVVAVRRASRSS